MDLRTSIDVSATGLHAQALRMRVIAENLANADSVAQTAGGDPYRRRVATFRAHLDHANGATAVQVVGITADKSPFGKIYQPGNPAADKAGYVQTPNVNGLIEMADMRAAQRSYQANLNAIEAARSMTARTLDLIK
ncbi:flagellar basal body rod protein FlgC [Sphingomonas endophytica]|uniref:Flagellar basal-body rod protein FlgC n=1 Tax=Sphingomonas endophytica TaxID=869719 RepID=A0A7X0JF30_9SPHN|nr:flagellar basal body rod protein FlgC [Sphingomonas endophytica]MBB5725677.1 flagellar basal-body rod protein FlgC [Sphingomonas endophytica]MBB6505361.1 flagellar basal-body rod protein FlgC [Sphingomonas endophytica]